MSSMILESHLENFFSLDFMIKVMIMAKHKTGMLMDRLDKKGIEGKINGWKNPKSKVL